MVRPDSDYCDYLTEKYAAISTNYNASASTTMGRAGGSLTVGHEQAAVYYNYANTNAAIASAEVKHISNATIYGSITLGAGSTMTGCVIYGGGSTMESDTLIEALFTLKPKLRRKYKGDVKAFRTDLLWAAQQRKEEDATAKLSDLLGIEGGK